MTTSPWGIDLGGTKIEGAILERPDSPETLVRLRIDTDAHLGYDHILDGIASVVQRLEREAGETRPSLIGIGTPGSRDRHTGLMRNCNSTALNGRPLLADLRAKLGVELEMANDANCFALAEARFGAAAGNRIVFGVILGTGVGGGIVVDGKPLEGHNGIAGEWGHNPMPGDFGKEPCYCGQVGCIETVLSGPALERFFERVSGRKLALEDIAALARKGNGAAQSTIARLTDGFGRAISLVVNILDPDAIVIGGGVGNIDELYDAGAVAASSHAFHDNFQTPILRPMLGDSAGVIGAALLASQ